MSNTEDRFFEWLSQNEQAETPTPAPARLKSRIYSALTRQQTESGPLASLPSTKAAGRSLCIFEQLVEMSPLPERAKCPNLCTICHARILAENIENAPIYWSGCPYVRFQSR